MWDSKFDQIITESLKCSLCCGTQRKVLIPCNKHSICIDCEKKPSVTRKRKKDGGKGTEFVIICPYKCGEFVLEEGRCLPATIINEMIDALSNFSSTGGSLCPKHVLHENRFHCISCANRQPLCLICFSEEHMGHNIGPRYMARPSSTDSSKAPAPAPAPAVAPAIVQVDSQDTQSSDSGGSSDDDDAGDTCDNGTDLDYQEPSIPSSSSSQKATAPVAPAAKPSHFTQRIRPAKNSFLKDRKSVV